MAKTVRTNVQPSRPTKTPKYAPFRLDVFLIEIASRFGVTGACVLSVIYLFFKSASDTQKTEFIDKFILLKIKQTDNVFALYIGILLVILFFIQNYFFRKKDKLKKERIEQLESHIQNLEEKLFKK